MAIFRTQNMAFPFAFFTVLWVGYQASRTLVQGYGNNFTIELIHRDSPSSPLFKASETPKMLANAVKRSARRVSRTRQNLISSKMAQALVSPSDGDYLMKMSIGSPPVETLYVLDTGSDLVWTQCSPCTRCFPQNFPLFDPAASSTYKKVTCDSTQCEALDESYCHSGSCVYTYTFGDGSSTQGVLATDTITLGSTDGQSFSLPNSIIGCGTNNVGYFDGTGIVGFGQGPVSLITRMKSLIDGKFSYCLVPLSSNHYSKLRFGANAILSGTKTLSTPLVSGEVDTYYYLRLEALTIGYKNHAGYNEVEYQFSSPMKMIIDSGTTLTYLPGELYSVFEQAFKDAIAVKPVDDPTGSLSLCYDSKANFVKPNISMSFTNAKVGLSDSNTFVHVTEDVVCLAFAASEGIAVYGNIQQMNFLVGYDLQQKTVSFEKAECDKY